MDKTLFDKYNSIEDSELQATSARRQLINDIVENMRGGKDKKATARRFAIAANTLRFTNQDLHYLSKRSNLPSVENYSAFVDSRFKVRSKNGQ